MYALRREPCSVLLFSVPYSVCRIPCSLIRVSLFRVPYSLFPHSFFRVLYSSFRTPYSVLSKYPVFHIPCSFFLNACSSSYLF